MKKRFLICILVAILVSALLVFASCSDEETAPAQSTVEAGVITTPASPDTDGTQSIQDGDVDSEEEKDADEGTDGDGTTPEAEDDPQEGSAEDGTEEAGEAPEDTQNASDDTETTQTDTEDPTDDTETSTGNDTPQTNEEGKIEGETSSNTGEEITGETPDTSDDTQTDGDGTQTGGEPTDDGTPEPTEEGLDTLLESDPEAYYRALAERGEIRILDTSLFKVDTFEEGTFVYGNTQAIQGEYAIYVGANKVGNLMIGGEGQALLETQKGETTITLRGGYNVALERVEIEGSDTVLFITRDTTPAIHSTYSIVLGADVYPLTFTDGMEVWQIEAAAQDVMRSLDAVIVPQEETPTGDDTPQNGEESAEEPPAEDTPTGGENTETPSDTEDNENVKPSDNTEENEEDKDLPNLPNDEQGSTEDGGTEGGPATPENEGSQGGEPADQSTEQPTAEPTGGETPSEESEGQEEQGGTSENGQPTEPTDPSAEPTEPTIEPTEPTIEPTEPSTETPSEPNDDPKNPAVIGVPEESECRDFILSFGGKCELIETTSYHMDAFYENYTVRLYDMTRQEYKDMTRRLSRLQDPEYAEDDLLPTALIVSGRIGEKGFSFTLRDGGGAGGVYSCIIDINGFLD